MCPIVTSSPRSLERLLARARSGDLVEVGCLGGHGRTGTALACLAVLTGAPPDGAVDWVRANYCPDAVETAEQRAFVESYGSLSYAAVRPAGSNA